MKIIDVQFDDDAVKYDVPKEIQERSTIGPRGQTTPSYVKFNAPQVILSVKYEGRTIDTLFRQRFLLSKGNAKELGVPEKID